MGASGELLQGGIVQQPRQQGVYRCVQDNCDCSVRGRGLGAQAGAGAARALNMVSTWQTTRASVMILTPVALSIAVVVTSPAVAVQRFDLDSQTSVQTGASVASYIVTTAAQVLYHLSVLVCFALLAAGGLDAAPQTPSFDGLSQGMPTSKV
ncbi:hypothetical protein V8F06_014778 [Rhypophila decipiens]